MSCPLTNIQYLIKVGYAILYKDKLNHKHTQNNRNLRTTPLNVIHPLWITNWNPTSLNDIKWNYFKSDRARGPKGGIEMK